MCVRHLFPRTDVSDAGSDTDLDRFPKDDVVANCTRSLRASRNLLNMQGTDVKVGSWSSSGGEGETRTGSIRGFVKVMVTGVKGLEV